MVKILTPSLKAIGRGTPLRFRAVHVSQDLLPLSQQKEDQDEGGPVKCFGGIITRKAVDMSYFFSYCPQVQTYLRACEHLLAAAQNNQQFSEEELQMVESYAMDVSKIRAAFVNGRNHLVS